LLLAVASLGGFFRQILEEHEAVLTPPQFVIRLTVDAVLPVMLVFFLFDQIAAYILSDHAPLISFNSNSLLSIYVLTGFMTGVALLAVSFPLRVYRKSRREKLTLWAETLTGESADGRRLRSRIRWVFEKRPG